MVDVLSAMLLGSLFTQPAPQRPTRVVSVCEVLADLRNFRGKMIAVRGRVLKSEEGASLTGERCPSALVTHGYVWPNPIPLSVRTGPGDLVVEPQSAQRLFEAASELDAQIWATYFGRLETRESFELVLRGDGKSVPYGYGHMNACPAELQVSEVWNVTIERKKSGK